MVDLIVIPVLHGCGRLLLSQIAAVLTVSSLIGVSRFRIVDIFTENYVLKLFFQHFEILYLN